MKSAHPPFFQPPFAAFSLEHLVALNYVPAGLFGEQCSAADLDGTNPPAVPRQHALPHDVAVGVAGVVAVIGRPDNRRAR